MKVSKEWLEIKIKELNDWLLENGISQLSIKLNQSLEYRIKKSNRDYYVSKLIELEENQLQTIKV
jgi:phage antirepressor YoqD-like protein